MTKGVVSLLAVFLCCSCLAGEGSAGSGATPDDSSPSLMDNERLGVILERVDEDVEGNPGAWTLSYGEFTVYVVTDERADRMRIIVPVASAESLAKEQLYRLMQANFETALDARYSVAQGLVWSAFIHPLSPLSEELVMSGLAQAVALAATYGSSFSSGLFIYRGGDHGQDPGGDIYRDIIEKGSTS